MAGSKTEPFTQLSDDQWFLIEDLFPDPPRTRAGGRPPRKNRDCFEGILFVLLSGCRWKEARAAAERGAMSEEERQNAVVSSAPSLEKRLPPAFQIVDRTRFVRDRLETAAGVEEKSQAARLGHACGRWHVCACKKRGRCVGNTKIGKGSKVMLLTDGHGTPVGLDVTSASPHEVKLVEPLVFRSQVRLPRRTRLLYDKASDSAPLRRRFSWLGIQLISPFRKKRDGSRRRLSARDQSHYSNRWKVERTIGWLKNLRRLGMRWEYHAHLFEGFWQLGCLFIILKGF